MAAWLVLVAALFATAVPARARTPSPSTSRAASVDVAPGVTAGIAVCDRRTGTCTERSNAHTQFRAASVEKVLIALVHLWDRGCRGRFGRKPPTTCPGRPADPQPPTSW